MSPIPQPYRQFSAVSRCRYSVSAVPTCAHVITREFQCLGPLVFLHVNLPGQRNTSNHKHLARKHGGITPGYLFKEGKGVKKEEQRKGKEQC